MHGLLLFDVVAQPRLFQVDVVGEFEDTFRLVTKSMLRQVLMDDANVLGEAIDRIGDPFVQIPRGMPECVEHKVADIGISMAIGLAPPIKLCEEARGSAYVLLGEHRSIVRAGE